MTFGEQMIDKHFVSADDREQARAWMDGQFPDPELGGEGRSPDPEIGADPDSILSRRQNLRILNNLLALQGNRALGLRVGRRARLSRAGALGLMMQSASTVRQAVRAGIEFAAIGGALGKLSVREDGNFVSIRFEPPATGQLLRPYLTEATFAAIRSYLSELTGTYRSEDAVETPSAAPAMRIAFAYPEPASAERYRAFFRCPLEFDADVSEMRLGPDILDQAPSVANALAFNQCRDVCARLVAETRAEAPLVREARRYLMLDPEKFTNLSVLAVQLGVPRRTLQRHFARAGASFSMLLSDVRSAIAQDLLSNASLKISDIALMIGYSEPANFRRAFRSWTGTSPSEYREALRRQS